MRRFSRLQATPAYKVAIGAPPEHGPGLRAPIVELVACTPPGCGGKGARRREIGMDAWALKQLPAAWLEALDEREQQVLRTLARDRPPRRCRVTLWPGKKPVGDSVGHSVDACHAASFCSC